MKIVDIVYVIGRGFIFIGEPEKVVHVGDKIRFDDHEFEISGVERLQYHKNVGLMLKHSDSAHDIIHKGDEIEVINKEKQL